MSIIIEKECSVCGETKMLSQFYTHPGTKDGFLGECKICKNTKNKQYKPHSKEKAIDLGEKAAEDVSGGRPRKS